MTTAAQVRGLGPVFSSTAAVATDATAYSFDPVNAADDDSAWYFDVPSNSNAGNHAFLSRTRFTTNQGLYVAVSLAPVGFRQLTSLTSNNNAWVVNDPILYGAVCAEGVASCRSALVAWKADAAWNGGAWWTAMNIGAPDTSSVSSFGIRNIQRHDVTTIAEGKTIIDGLMT